jgi:hypothetical protein
LIKARESGLELLDRYDGFDHAAFVKTFGPYLWTYIGGFQELVDLFETIHGADLDRESIADHLKGWRKPVIKSLPQGWKDCFQHPSASWHNLRLEQIDRAFAGEAMRFDRACQVIKTLELAFANTKEPVLHNLDFYRFITLRPAVFVLKKLTSAAKAWLENGGDQRFDNLVGALCGDKTTRAAGARLFLSYAAAGKGMTLDNALLIKAHMEMRADHDKARLSKLGAVEIGTLTKRGRHDHCNKVESIFVRLDSTKLAELATMAPAQLAAVAQRRA